MKKKLKVILYIDILILFTMISYKLYLFAFEKDFESANITNIIQVQEDVNSKQDFSFVVLGKIENSIDVFNNRIIPSINDDKDIDFVITTGNAVLDGAEDKYRILGKSLGKLTVPVIAGVGDKEVSDGGALRYYRHFGPFYFSFAVSDCYFIFLDTTGETSEDWQKEWLRGELEYSSKYRHIFVFMNKLPYISDIPGIYSVKSTITNESYRDFLTDTFLKYNVDAVFVSGAAIYEDKIIGSVPYYVSGGAGGGLISYETSFYHYLKIDVNNSGIDASVIKQESSSTPLFIKPFERIWIYIHSLFYINMVNFILIVCVLVLLGTILYVRVTKEVNYYRDFNIDQSDEPIKERLKIAMFTNNYFPFIGGVPISIHRLAKGLRKQGHQVYIFAPKYPGQSPDDDPYVIRCGLLTYYKTKAFNFAIVNIFSPKIVKEFVKHEFDVIHVHHPFWMGKKGLKLGKKHNIPVVLTHHTRFDSYHHNLPFMRLIFKNIISHYLVREFAQKCTAVISPTETSKEYLSNIGVSRPIEILPTGIDLECFENMTDDKLRSAYAPDGEILLCSVLRLSQEKNIYFLIDCMEYIKEHTGIPFKCIIIGDGPEKEDIIKTISEKGLHESVLLIGNVPPDEVCRYYLASDIFVFTSKSETQGMVLLEAMAGKCPVVAVSSSGIEDIITNDYNGYKTAEGIEAWAQKVLLLMNDKEKLKDMSQNAYRYAEKYSLDEMAGHAADTYIKAMMNHKLYKAMQSYEKE